MIIPVDFAQVNYKFGGTSLPRGAEVVLGVKPGTPTSALNVAVAAQAAWVASMKGYTSSTVVLEGVLAKLGPNATGPSAEYDSPVACTGSGATTTPNVAILAKKVTALGGRKGRGRMYLPSPTEGTVDSSGFIDGTTLAIIQGLLDDWVAALATNDLTPYLLHGDATAPTEITQFEAQSQCATQRRRNRK